MDSLARVPNPFMDMLLSTRVFQVRSPAPVKFLRASNTMADVVKMLRLHNVLSFPVLNDDNVCLGLVDGLDVVRFLMQYSTPEKKTASSCCDPAPSVDDVCSASVELFINASQVNPYIPVFATSSLHAVITILAPGCHRTVAFVHEGSNELYGMFSETDLIAHLRKYIRSVSSSGSANMHVARVADLPINCFSSHISRPWHRVFSDEPVSAATTPLAGSRQFSAVSADSDDTVCNATTAEMNSEGDFDYSSLLVAIFDRESGRLVGHLDASALKPSATDAAGAASSPSTTAAAAAAAVGASVGVGVGPALAAVADAAAAAAAGPAPSANSTATAGDASLGGSDAVAAAAIAGGSKSVQEYLNPHMEMTVGEYVRLFAPSALGGWAVPETVTFRDLLDVFAGEWLDPATAEVRATARAARFAAHAATAPTRDAASSARAAARAAIFAANARAAAAAAAAHTASSPGVAAAAPVGAVDVDADFSDDDEADSSFAVTAVRATRIAAAAAVAATAAAAGAAPDAAAAAAAAAATADAAAADAAAAAADAAAVSAAADAAAAAAAAAAAEAVAAVIAAAASAASGEEAIAAAKKAAAAEALYAAKVPAAAKRLHHVWVLEGLEKPMPLEMCPTNALAGDKVMGVVTLNDALRWVARDNLWLRVDKLPVEKDE